MKFPAIKLFLIAKVRIFFETGKTFLPFISNNSMAAILPTTLKKSANTPTCRPK